MTCSYCGVSTSSMSFNELVEHTANHIEIIDDGWFYTLPEEYQT
jgi:hypothetical protein